MQSIDTGEWKNSQPTLSTNIPRRRGPGRLLYELRVGHWRSRGRGGDVEGGGGGLRGERMLLGVVTEHGVLDEGQDAKQPISTRGGPSKNQPGQGAVPCLSAATMMDTSPVLWKRGRRAMEDPRG